MGVDFITTCTPTFTRGWDIGLADIQTADLFTDMPSESSRTYRATAEDGADAKEGDTVFIRPTGTTITVVRGRSPIGVIGRPPQSLLDRIAGDGRGIATGIISKLYKRSGDFDVRLN